eukprot:13457517-Alexandrium_andersonii.AAC.1
MLPSVALRPRVGKGHLDAFGGPQDIRAEPHLRLPGAGHRHGPLQELHSRPRPPGVLGALLAWPRRAPGA